ncbi:hypothetical protein KXD40_005454 [Peronospora effusa]|nr:hypothetical protein KXD40_005454 [Peronospora effusa]
MSEPNEVVALLPTTSADPVASKVDAEPNAHHALLGITCVAIASLCFSFTVTFIKYMTFTFSSMEATFWRSVGVFVCNYIVVKVSDIRLDVPPEYRKLLLLRCISGFACMGFSFYAMSQMVLADASSLVFSSPIMTFFFASFSLLGTATMTGTKGALFLHEKIDVVSLLCAIVAFGGLICVVRPGLLFGYDHATAATDGSRIAVASAFLAALSQVLMFLTIRQLQGLNVFVIVHYFALASIILTMLWLALIQQSFYIPSTFLLWRAIVGTGICTFGGQMFLTRGFQLEKAGVAAVMRYLDVVFVFIWDSVILGEHINHWSIVGAMIILTCAVVIAILAKHVSEHHRLLPTTSLNVKPEYQPHALLGMACVALSSVCFSLMSTMIKLNTYTMTSIEAIFWRSIVAMALNYVSIWYSGKTLYVAPKDRMMLFYRCLAGFLSISFAFYALSQMVLADSSVIVFTSPVFTFFLGACLLHEHIDTPSFACSLLSFGGLICVVRPIFIFGYNHATAQTDGSWIAVGSALLGAIGQAFVFITVRKLKGIHFMVIVHYFMLFSMTGSLVYMLVVQRVFVVPSTLGIWLSVVGSGAFTFIGQLLLTKGFQLEKAGIASVMRYLDVVCVFIWDYLLLGEKINYWSVVGAAIICACAVVIALRKAHLS